MYICDRCQKGLQVGMNVSHAHNRTKKRSLPNLHVITVRDAGKNKTMRLCTKCTRLVRKQYPYKVEEAAILPQLEKVEEKEVKVAKNEPSSEKREEAVVAK